MRRRSFVKEQLATVPLFAACSKRELGLISQLSTGVSVPADETLTQEGEFGREFFIILDGRASVSQKGRKIGVLHSGDYLGEIALIRTVNAQPPSSPTHPCDLRSSNGGTSHDSSTKPLAFSQALARDGPHHRGPVRADTPGSSGSAHATFGVLAPRPAMRTASCRHNARSAEGHLDRAGSDAARRRLATEGGSADAEPTASTCSAGPDRASWTSTMDKRRPDRRRPSSPHVGLTGLSPPWCGRDRCRRAGVTQRVSRSA